MVKERGSAVGGQIDRHSGPHHEGFGMIDANALATHESHGERSKRRPASEGGQRAIEVLAFHGVLAGKINSCKRNFALSE
jgi:hypothetical protein